MEPMQEAVNDTVEQIAYVLDDMADAAASGDGVSVVELCDWCINQLNMLSRTVGSLSSADED